MTKIYLFRHGYLNTFVAGSKIVYEFPSIHNEIPDGYMKWYDYTVNPVAVSNAYSILSTDRCYVHCDGIADISRIGDGVSVTIHTATPITIPNDCRLTIKGDWYTGYGRIAVFATKRITYSTTLPSLEVYPTLNGSHDGSTYDIFGDDDTIVNKLEAFGKVYDENTAPTIDNIHVGKFHINLSSLAGKSLYIKIGVDVAGGSTGADIDMTEVYLESNKKQSIIF